MASNHLFTALDSLSVQPLENLVPYITDSGIDGSHPNRATGWNRI